MTSSPEILADMAAYHAAVAALDANDDAGRAELLRRFRLQHGGIRIYDQVLGFQVTGGLDPVAPAPEAL